MDAPNIVPRDLASGPRFAIERPKDQAKRLEMARLDTYVPAPALKNEWVIAKASLDRAEAKLHAAKARSEEAHATAETWREHCRSSLGFILAFVTVGLWGYFMLAMRAVTSSNAEGADVAVKDAEDSRQKSIDQASNIARQSDRLKTAQGPQAALATPRTTPR